MFSHSSFTSLHDVRCHHGRCPCLLSALAGLFCDELLQGGFGAGFKPPAASLPSGLESTVGFSCSCLGSAERMATERAKTGDNPSPRPASPGPWETFNPFGLKRKLLDMYSRA